MDVKAPPRTVQAGDEVAGLRLEAEVGRGGMGVVFRATQPALGRTVAVKAIAPAFALDLPFRARFVREAQIAAAISHPNVIPVHEVVEEDGLLLLVMAFVEGADLATLVEREGPLAPDRAARLVAQAAGALAAAHERGLVHRDVKPANVLVAEGDHAYLTDFGLAVHRDERDGLRPGGGFVGSADFVAPEQVRGEVADGPADQYALGGVLHFLLTGRPPYPRDTPVATLFAHLDEPPPVPSEHGAPRAFDPVVARAMAKAPGDRFPGVVALGEAALEAAYGSSPAVTIDGQGSFEVAAPPPPSGVAFDLVEAFRYVHQPLDPADPVLPMLGNEDVVGALADRIRHSAGGSFLVTGFRGVGKTTVIHHALDALAEDGDVLPIHLTVARPKTAEELLFDVIRRLFEALVDAGVLDTLSAEVRRQLVLAYMRTSLSYKATHEQGRERSAGLSLGLAGGLLDRLGPKLELSGSASESLATEAGFLTYSEADVEHDFFRIVSLLRRGEPAAAVPPRAWRRLLRRGGEPPPAPWNGKVVVVLDELDKLTAQDGTATIEALLTALKNLFTTRGVHFLFVGGPDLHEMALQAGYRGNSVYDSVFGWQLYVPCAWDAAERLLRAVVPDAGGEERTLASLLDHLRFKSRGVPRLLLAELNALVAWEDGRPRIRLAGVDLARVEFYAGLERALGRFREAGGAAHAFTVPIDEDRWRVGAYYVADRILRTKGRAFTLEELTGLDPLLAVEPARVERLVDHLAEHGVVERVHGGGAGETYVGDAEQVAQFRLAADVRRKLTSFAEANERERAQAPPPQTDPGGVVGGHFELLEVLDRAGLGHVHRARDRRTGQEVAVKLTAADGRVLERLERKARLAQEVSPTIGVVPTYEVFREPDGRLGVAMELLQGAPLHRVARQARLVPRDAVGLASSVADAVDRLHARGVFRLDLKPSSVMVDDALNPVVVDLGMAKRLGAAGQDAATPVTDVGVGVGTPAYAAPEQLTGGEVTPAADVFSVAAILVELLTGHPPRGDGDLATVLRRAATEDVALEDVPASAPLREALAAALARDATARPTAGEWAAALRRTPEFGGVPGA
jgi:serine/threonine protein kinase